MKRLTYTQQGIYNDSMLYEGKLRHTIGGYIALKGHPDREILEEAIRRLIGEQTALRTRSLFKLVVLTSVLRGKPFQYFKLLR